MAETTPLPAPPEPPLDATVVQLQPAKPAEPTAAKDQPPPPPYMPFPPYPYFHPGYPPFPMPEGQSPPGQPHPFYPPHPAYMGYYYPPPPGPMPYYPPQPPAVAMPPAKSPAEVAAAQHNQRLLVLGIISVLSLVHLPWLAYLFAMHGCWGNFFDLCFAAAQGADGLNETPFLFAQVAFFILRVQTTLAVDFQQFTQVMQIGTGLGSFALTKIVAANGTVVEGRWQRYGLAATCAVAFVVLFWAELTLSSTANYPVLGDETVLGYIDSELPADFVGASEAKAGLMKYLQFLRLADALIFGAALAMPKSPKTAPVRI